MNLKNLDNLVEIKKLKKEEKNQTEFDGLVQAGEKRLQDAKRVDLAVYEGLDVEDKLVTELLAATDKLLRAVKSLA